MPTYTYDPFQTSARDRARFYVGDTDMSRPLMADEEYDAQLTGADYNVALANILEALANRFSALPDEYDETGRIKISWRKRGDAWMQNAKRLRGEGPDETPFSPQQSGVALGEMAVDTTGYRPHRNTGRLPWAPWNG